LGPGQSYRQGKQQNGPVDKRGDPYQERGKQVDKERRGVLSIVLSHIYDQLFTATRSGGERKLVRLFWRRQQLLSKITSTQYQIKVVSYEFLVCFT